MTKDYVNEVINQSRSRLKYPTTHLNPPGNATHQRHLYAKSVSVSSFNDSWCDGPLIILAFPDFQTFTFSLLPVAVWAVQRWRLQARGLQLTVDCSTSRSVCTCSGRFMFNWRSAGRLLDARWKLPTSFSSSGALLRCWDSLIDPDQVIFTSVGPHLHATHQHGRMCTAFSANRRARDAICWAVAVPLGERRRKMSIISRVRDVTVARGGKLNAQSKFCRC